MFLFRDTSRETKIYTFIFQFHAHHIPSPGISQPGVDRMQIKAEKRKLIRKKTGYIKIEAREK